MRIAKLFIYFLIFFSFESYSKTIFDFGKEGAHFRPYYLKQLSPGKANDEQRAENLFRDWGVSPGQYLIRDTNKSGRYILSYQTQELKLMNFVLEEGPNRKLVFAKESSDALKTKKAENLVGEDVTQYINQKNLRVYKPTFFNPSSFNCYEQDPFKNNFTLCENQDSSLPLNEKRINPIKKLFQKMSPKKDIIISGNFGPPNRGDYEIAKEALKNSNHITIVINSKSVNGISSITNGQIWDYYLKKLTKGTKKTFDLVFTDDPFKGSVALAEKKGSYQILLPRVVNDQFNDIDDKIRELLRETYYRDKNDKFKAMDIEFRKVDRDEKEDLPSRNFKKCLERYMNSVNYECENYFPELDVAAKKDIFKKIRSDLSVK